MSRRYRFAVFKMFSMHMWSFWRVMSPRCDFASFTERFRGQIYRFGCQNIHFWCQKIHFWCPNIHFYILSDTITLISSQKQLFTHKNEKEHAWRHSDLSDPIPTPILVLAGSAPASSLSALTSAVATSPWATSSKLCARITFSTISPSQRSGRTSRFWRLCQSAR